jgi:hypothetical protein
MTVYVGDMNLRADVPNSGRVVRGRWSYLYADSEAELREFARKVGLRPEWIQHPGEIGVHFDVTASVRQRAIRQGTRGVTWREAGERVAGLRRDQKAQERCEDVGCLDRPGHDPDTPRPPEGPVRHSWTETEHQGQKVCMRCHMWAEQRWNPATRRPLVIYSKGDRRLVAERVPRCGSELPDSGNTPEERKHLATAADRQAAQAYKAGDHDRAFRLITDARVLDPERSGLWDQREGLIRDKARQPDKAAEPERDDAQIQRELEEWSLWNQSIYQRGQKEAVLNARENRGVPRR